MLESKTIFKICISGFNACCRDDAVAD